MTEEWRPVVGFEGLYEVSNLGRVRSLGFRKPNALTGGYSDHPGKILSQFPVIDGYLRVTLYRQQKMYPRNVHKIVAPAFLGPAPEGKPWVLHNDGENTNNVVENLRWGSPSDNAQDTIRHGRNVSLNATSCANGHEYTLENTAYERNGSRRCKTCRGASAKIRRDNREPEDMPSTASHGTSYAYGYWKCRCEGCRDWKRSTRINEKTN